MPLFPLYEVENGKITINYDPETAGKKIPVGDWLSMMGRTKHLLEEPYLELTEEIQKEIDRRYRVLKERAKA